MTSHSDDTATDNTRAAVAGTVATAGDSVGDGAVATVTVTNPDDETIVTGSGQNKIVIPAGRRNPVARIAE